MTEINNIDKYYTIAQPVFSEIKVKGSNFIAGAYPVPNSETALYTLKTIRTKYFDATHNCFAYRIGFDGTDFRASDDGEPSGTAGKPILFMISKYELSDVLVVVTRYFGGTKLGVGGLVRAYSDSAESVLQIVDRKIINRTRKFTVKCDYQDVSLVKKLIESVAVNHNEVYTDIVEFEVDVPLSKSDGFFELIFNATNSKVSPIEII